MSVTNVDGSGINDNTFLKPLTTTEQSNFEALISEIFKISRESFKAGNHQNFSDVDAYADLKKRMDLYDTTAIPEKFRKKWELAKKIVQSNLTFKHLCKESTEIISKAKKTIELVNSKTNEMKSSMSESSLNRERQRRLMGPLAMLQELRNRILSHDLREVQKHPELVNALEDIGKILDLEDPTDIQQARFLHGLHLEADLPVGFEKITDTSVVNYSKFSGVNVENARSVESDFYSLQESSVNLERREIYSHSHFVSLEETLIKGAKRVDAHNILNVSEMAAKIKDEVKKYSDTTNYNSWPTLVKFIDHFQEMKRNNSSVTPAKAFQKFDPDYKEVQEFGNVCTGQSMAILNQLKEKYGLHGYLVVQKEGVTGLPMHTAVVIPCRDGILLVETLNKQQPVIAIKSDQETRVEMFGQDSALEIDSKSGPYTKLVKKAYEIKKDGTVRIYKTEFPLAELSIKAVMLKYLVDRTEFSLWSEATDYSMIINVHDGNLVFKRGQGREAFRKTVSFSEINSVEADQLLGQFCSKMNIPKNKAQAMLKKIVDNHIIIKELLTQTRTPLPTSNNFK